MNETVIAATTADADTESTSAPVKEDVAGLRIYSHSTIYYWWPVWVTGYIMAAITYFHGGQIELDQVRNEFFHPSAGPGIIYILVLFLVITFTNVKVRGIYSVTVLFALSFLTVLFAWLGLWDNVFAIIPTLSIHMNMGFYLFFSTLLLILWLSMFFIFDRLTFWRIRPGQMTEERVIGGGEKSYDVRGMLFEQKQDDFFRHYLLGLGAGDLKLLTTGARQVKIEIPNVLFAEKKVKQIQRLIAIKSDDLRDLAGNN